MILGVDERAFTETQRKIFRMLSDGAVHTKEELVQNCLFDEMGALRNVAPHICMLRRKLPKGILIVHVSPGGTRGKGYQMVRHIRSSHE